jgi:hypothetical protein
LLLAGILYCCDEQRINSTKNQSGSILRDPKFFEDYTHRTELAESKLQKVQADESGKKEPIGAVKERAGLDTKGKAEKNKKARENVYPIGNYHRLCPIFYLISFALKARTEKLAYFFDEFENSLIGNFIINKISILAVIDYPLTP